MSIDDALAIAMTGLNQRFKCKAVTLLGDTQRRVVDSLTSGILPLDLALGVGGFPRGRIIEIYGPESSGKTTLCLTTLAAAQRAGLAGVIIDTEHALDPHYAELCGVTISDLIISQPDYGEQGLEIAETLIRTGKVGVCVVDSVAALVPRAEIDGDIGDAHVGLQARLMSQTMRRFVGVVAMTKTVVIFTNQLRDKIGVIYGSSETTTGGKALKFYATVRLDVRKGDLIKQGNDVIGNVVKVKVVKNKVGAPYKTCTFEILYDEGPSKEGGLLDVGLECGILTAKGSHYYFGDEKLGHGREAARGLLKANPDLARQIDAAVRGQMFTRSLEDV